MYLNEETIECINKEFLNAFGIIYHEFCLLDPEKQNELVNVYHKSHPQVKSKDGYVIAGETRDEYNQRMNQREEAAFGKIGSDKTTGISKAKSFMSDFLNKLNTGYFKKETCPQVGNEFT